MRNREQWAGCRGGQGSPRALALKEEKRIIVVS
jgi:hypothetical protein